MRQAFVTSAFVVPVSCRKPQHNAARGNAKGYNDGHLDRFAGGITAGEDEYRHSGSIGLIEKLEKSYARVLFDAPFNG